MQFTTIVALFASLAIAAPAEVVERAADAAQDGPCPSGVTNNSPQCCGAGLLNLLYVDCKTPTQSSSILNPLSSICAREGRQAKCCTVGIAGLGVLCQDALPE